MLLTLGMLSALAQPAPPATDAPHLRASLASDAHLVAWSLGPVDDAVPLPDTVRLHVAPDGTVREVASPLPLPERVDAALRQLGFAPADAPRTVEVALERGEAVPGGVQVAVTDPNGLPVLGAAVRLVRDDEAVALSPSPDGFAVDGVRPGTWRVEVSAEAYLPETATVEVRSGETAAVTVSLPFDPEVGAIDVVALTEAEQLDRSAEAVTVVDTEQEQRQSADMGEVMARTQGIGVRRGGGLGSGTRFSLAGLTGEQVRFTLDGVPMALAGFPFGISNVPVGLVERVEVYRGVVPVRFGADALGGAVNLVSTAPRDDLGASLSYQGGSFDTHRLSGHLTAPLGGGVHARVTGFLDAAENDYPVDVEVADLSGRLTPATVRRFHDGYRAGGGALELGVSDRPWAERLSVRGFASGYRREIQNNIVMTVPYGEPVARTETAGASATWGHDLSERVEVEAVMGYTRTNRAFTDDGTCVVDWFGRCVRERSTPGEIANPATDRRVGDDAALARLRMQVTDGGVHTVSATVAPTFFSRSGEDRLHHGPHRDPTTARRDALQVVSGVEHTLDLLFPALQNVAFVKHYVQAVASEEPLPGGTFDDVDRTSWRIGFGDGLRLHLGERARVKLSYEYATRLPTPEEIFGDALLVVDNLELTPESSHNANLQVTVDTADTPVGDVRLDATGFLRHARDLVVLLGTDRFFSHHNVFAARSVGVEGAASWTSPGDWIGFDLNGTWLDLRNVSDEGAFGAYAGDRVPNRPYLFANTAVRLGASDVATTGDRLSFDLYSRYVHAFYRSWESVGLREFKQQVPSQLSHTAAVTYAVETDRGGVSGSVEVQNLTDAALYDFFGVQRPGRAVYGKVTVTR